MPIGLPHCFVLQYLNPRLIVELLPFQWFFIQVHQELIEKRVAAYEGQTISEGIHTSPAGRDARYRRAAHAPHP